MLEINEIARLYEEKKPVYEQLEEEIEHAIKQALGKTDIKYHSVTTRVKKLSSLLSKIENKEIENPFTEVMDIVGARVVALFLGDVGKIVTLLKQTFDIKSIDDKIDEGDPKLFGYLSVHLLAELKSSFSGPRYDQIKNLTFEIQVRTIAMDAWASASHFLDYKSEADVPADLKRDFNALSGLFYLADKHFEMFFRSRAATIKRLDRAFKGDNPPLSDPLNVDSLTAYLKDKYPTRKQPTGDEAIALLRDLRAGKVADLAEMDSLLSMHEQEFIQLESTRTKGPFAAVGVVRISLRDCAKRIPEQ